MKHTQVETQSVIWAGQLCSVIAETESQIKVRFTNATGTGEVWLSRSANLYRPAAQVQDNSMPKYVSAWTPELVKQWLEHSPTEPGPVAAGLRGWCIGYNFFCSRCCGRLAARGIILPREASPVWSDRNPEFAVCAACGNPAK